MEDAEEMLDVLGDERLHEFIRGHPANLEELRARYATLVSGSSRQGEAWLNWVIRRRSDRRAIGTVQATVTDAEAGPSALVAWVIGIPWQAQGFASEAARALVEWLQ